MRAGEGEASLIPDEEQLARSVPWRYVAAGFLPAKCCPTARRRRHGQMAVDASRPDRGPVGHRAQVVFQVPRPIGANGFHPGRPFPLPRECPVALPDISEKVSHECIPATQADQEIWAPDSPSSG